MNVALMGSVSSSTHVLEALIRGGVEITGVLGLDESKAASVSDYHSLRPLAEKAHLPYHAFTKVADPAVAEFLREHRPDLLWVIGLSQLVPAPLINLARHGGVGFHPTMLPRGRGRAPVAWTILRNEPAAANLFFLSDEPDAGDIIVQRPVPVLPDDYSEDLIHRTNLVLGEVVLELAPLIKSGRLPRTPQDHSQASYYPRRTPADGRIDWTQPTELIYRLIRAAGRPYPGAFTTLSDEKMIVWRAKPGPSHIPPLPTGDRKGGAGDHDVSGRVVSLEPSGRGIEIRTGDGTLWLTEATMETRPHEPVFGILRTGSVLT